MIDRQRLLNPFSWDFGAWKKFFAVSALWNLFGSIPAIIFPKLNMLTLYGVDTDDYYVLFLNRSFWMAVLVFGIGYFIISLNPGRHVGIIVMGIIGKTAVVAIWFYMFSIDKATGFVVFGATGDSIFTLLFILYLLIGPRSADDGKPSNP